MNEKFIVCKDEEKKNYLLSKGFKLLTQKKNRKGEEVFTFINESKLSLLFSKEDNEGLKYTNKMYF